MKEFEEVAIPRDLVDRFVALSVRLFLDRIDRDAEAAAAKEAAAVDAARRGAAAFVDYLNALQGGSGRRWRLEESRLRDVDESPDDERI